METGAFHFSVIMGLGVVDMSDKEAKSGITESLPIDKSGIFCKVLTGDLNKTSERKKRCYQ